MGARAIGLYRSVLEAQSVNPFAGLPPPGGSRQGNQARRGDIRRVRRRRPNCKSASNRDPARDWS